MKSYRREQELAGKATFRSGDRQIVLVKKPGERAEHVLMKAFTWAILLTTYNDVRVEERLRYRYKPDVTAFDDSGELRVWVEAGHTGTRKMQQLISRSGPELWFARWQPPTPRNHFRTELQRQVRRAEKPGKHVVLYEFDDSCHQAIISGGTIDVPKLLELARHDTIN